MLMVFFKVDNSMDYDRHTFDVYENPQDIMDMLSELPDEEIRIYDTDNYGYGSEPSPNMADFENDYNDELLDGGWWCIVLKKVSM